MVYNNCTTRIDGIFFIMKFNKKWTMMNPADHLSQIVYTEIHAGHIYQPGSNYPPTISPQRP